jgi:hypothetical protein
MNIQTFGTMKVLILGFSLESSRKKCHLDVAPMENHKVYYREENVFSPKGCESCKAYV